MAKRVFFSFHYKDVVEFRANVVRNHWRAKLGREECGYYDASIWESTKKQGHAALKRLINSGLERTTNTCVLIGTQTYKRPWVRYELLKSFKRGNAIFGVHINSIRSRDRRTKIRGRNPLDYLGVTSSDSGSTATLWELVNGDWVPYDKIDGSASYRTRVPKEYRGNGYTFSELFDTYDWVSDDGFNNFASWVR